MLFSAFSAPLSLFLLLFSPPPISSGTDQGFYELLGVPPDADLRAIRRAFKRLALERHPDKNPDDPDAHAAFVRINRAYEVLKDEELRKRYDQFGEKGLEDNDGGGGAGRGGWGQHYQSWEFYNDKFGIYDDDPEIVTLSRADFQEEVFESGETWFVNFYSTYCSHCHHLAPTWRAFARAMDGVVRIGAVNCAEDPGLCQYHQVHSYPSLVLFPQRLWYQGVREQDALASFLLANLPHSQPLRSPPELPHSRRPLLVELCDGDDCMEEQERTKCAAILGRLGGAFAVLDCADRDQELCHQLYHHTDGFLFFPEGPQGSESTELFFADLPDLRSQLLQLLPPLPRLDSAELHWLLHRPPTEVDNEPEPMLTIFVRNEGDGTDPEWSTLAQRFPEMNIHVVPCGDSDDLSTLCTGMHLGKLPRPVLFRPGGGYDIHYGNLQMDTRQIAKFIVRSRSSHLIVLDQQKYSEIIENPTERVLWLVDHFAPWCPPCLRLLGELRKMPAEAEGHALRIGTLDCDAHRQLCRQAGVNSYPHSILLMPDGSRHSIVGGSHSVDQLLEFIGEALHPSVEALDGASFEAKVVGREQGQMVFVDFYAPWCGPCQQLAPEFRRLARQFPSASPAARLLRFASVDCDAHPHICNAQGVHAYPTLRLYRHRHDLEPHDYPSNWWRNVQSMAQWLGEMMPSLVQRLAGDFHTTVLGSPEPFLVDFYAPWCGHCVQFAPIFEQLAQLLEGQVRLAKLDCDRFGHICQMVGIQGFPSVMLYPGVDRLGDRQHPQGLHVQHGFDAERMANRVREMLRKERKRDEL